MGEARRKRARQGSGFPQWRYYRSGKRVQVQTATELDALPDGHAAQPQGPFADGLAGRVPWTDPARGPFAPVFQPQLDAYGRARGDLFRHEPTGRWFQNRAALEAYRRQYDANDLSDWIDATIPELDPDDPDFWKGVRLLPPPHRL